MTDHFSRWKQGWNELQKMWQIIGYSGTIKALHKTVLVEAPKDRQILPEKLKDKATRSNLASLFSTPDQ